MYRLIFEPGSVTVFAKDLADASEQIEARRASYETVKMERIKEEEKT